MIILGLIFLISLAVVIVLSVLIAEQDKIPVFVSGKLTTKKTLTSCSIDQMHF